MPGLKRFSTYFSNVRRFASSSSYLERSVFHFGRYSKFVAAVGTIWAGAFVIDTVVNDDVDLIFDRFRTRNSQEEIKKRPKVVILGGGWAALSFLRRLHTDHFNVSIVSPRNYFLFTPLLASSASGTLSQSSIVEPIRQFCIRSDASEAKYVQAECIEIDSSNNRVVCVDTSDHSSSTSFELSYDYLIVSVGAQNATFGIPGIEEHAHFLKETGHAASLRDHVLKNMERACVPGQSDETIDRLLSFVIVGGGPTGVEYASELKDFIDNDLSRHFPSVAKRAKVTIVEGMPHILNAFSPKLVDYTEKHFREKLNIEIKNNSFVSKVDASKVTVKNKSGQLAEFPYGVLVWSAGITTRPLIRKLIAKIGEEFQNDRRGLRVDDRLLVKGTRNIFALGDCAISGFAPTAQVASQQGSYLGRLFNQLSDPLFQRHKNAISSEALEEVFDSTSPFSYNHFGSFAYIGNREAIADLTQFDNKDKGSTWKGFMTFAAWRSVYFSKLLSYKNRYLVLSDWMKTYFFGRDVSRVNNTNSSRNKQLHPSVATNN
jgi:NADH:ubiquinone reductase (non-electrogenic)